MSQFWVFRNDTKENLETKHYINWTLISSLMIVVLLGERGELGSKEIRRKLTDWRCYQTIRTRDELKFYLELGTK